jgi:hypothetical protein
MLHSHRRWQIPVTSGSLSSCKINRTHSEPSLAPPFSLLTCALLVVAVYSKQDLADILSDPALLSALTHSPQTMHPSLRGPHDALQAALAENMERAAQLLDQEARLAHQRSAAQAQLLSTHALERQWRAKQADMDHALAPFAPASLYQRLAQGVAEQEGVSYALEESFLEGDGDGALATEREVGDWARRYREAKKLYYLRQERKERWDEGRVGGWR